MKTIDIAKDFSTYPSGRDPKDGTYNGTRFRQELLVPALAAAIAGGSTDDVVLVDIDGVRTFGSSFLEEAFGGLIREEQFTLDQLTRALKIKCTKVHLRIYEHAIRSYLEDAERERSAGITKLFA